MAQLKISLVRSLIGQKKDQIATAQALGLRKVGDVSIQPDNQLYVYLLWPKLSTSSR